MKAPTWRGALAAARRSMPAALIFLLAVASVVPLRLPEYESIAPSWILVAVFFFAVTRPDLLPAGVVFAIGVVADMLSGAPLGLSALVLLLVREAASLLVEFVKGRPFVVAWACFGGAALGAQILGVALAASLTGNMAAIGPAVIQTLLTVAVYPVVAGVLALAARPALSGV